MAAFLLLMAASVFWSSIRAPDQVLTETARSTVNVSSPANIDKEKSTVEMPSGEILPPKNLINISGRVISRQSGEGIESTRLTLHRKTPALRPSSSPMKSEAQAGTDGAYTITVSANTTYYLVAQADGYRMQTQTVMIFDKSVAEVNFQLDQSSNLSGRIIDAGRQPIEHAVMKFVANEDESISLPISPPSAKDGSFSVADLPPDITLRAYVDYVPPGYGRQYAEIGLVPIGDLEFRLKPGEHRTGVEIIVPRHRDRYISGVVVDETGAPLAGVRVRAQHVGQAGYSPLGISEPQLTSDDGAFDVRFLEPDVVDLVLEAKTYDPLTIAAVSVPTEDLKVTLTSSRFGQIAGTVLDRDTREPIESAHVFLHSVARAAGSIQADAAFWTKVKKGDGRVKPGGKFVIDRVPTGTARLCAYAPRYGLAQQDGIAVQPETTTDVELLLVRSGVLKVRAEYAGALADVPFENGGVSCRPIGNDESGYGLSNTMDNYLRLRKTGPIPFPQKGPLIVVMELGEGTYEVATFLQLNLSGADPELVVGPYVFRRSQADIHSGETTELNITFSGTASIRGSVQPRENEARMVITLSPGSNSSRIEENPLFDRDATYFGNRDRLIHEFGDLQLAHPWEGNFAFFGLEPGVYTVTAMVLLNDGVTTTVRGRSTVTLADDEVATVNIE